MMDSKSVSGISPSTYGFAISKAISRNEGSGVRFMYEASSFGNEVGMYSPPVTGFIPLRTAVLKFALIFLSRVSVYVMLFTCIEKKSFENLCIIIQEKYIMCKRYFKFTAVFPHNLQEWGFGAMI